MSIFDVSLTVVKIDTNLYLFVCIYFKKKYKYLVLHKSTYLLLIITTSVHG